MPELRSGGTGQPCSGVHAFSGCHLHLLVYRSSSFVGPFETCCRHAYRLTVAFHLRDYPRCESDQNPLGSKILSGLYDFCVLTTAHRSFKWVFACVEASNLDRTSRSLSESLPSNHWKWMQLSLLRMATFRGQRRSQRMHSKPPASNPP